MQQIEIKQIVRLGFRRLSWQRKIYSVEHITIFFVDEIDSISFFTFKDLWIPKKVIFNDPATIVYWPDGSKTVVKCGNGDVYDREKGFAMCVLKRLYGDKFHSILKKHIPQKKMIR